MKLSVSKSRSSVRSCTLKNMVFPSVITRFGSIVSLWLGRFEKYSWMQSIEWSYLTSWIRSTNNPKYYRCWKSCKWTSSILKSRDMINLIKCRTISRWHCKANLIFKSKVSSRASFLRIKNQTIRCKIKTLNYNLWMLKNWMNQGAFMT